MRVGVFDSGIGGLTVLKNLYKHHPNNEYIYYGDTLNLPYGSKSVDELKKLSSKNVDFLLDKKVDMIIIACGTVSSNCLEYLKNKYNIPIYDIITPTIDYLNNSSYSNIGVIATERTIDSSIFKDNINKNLKEIKAPLLVPIIENNRCEELENVLNIYLKDCINKIDILVLGCTHYPIIKDNIDKYFNKKIKLLDMSDLILDKLKDDKKSSITIYFSKLNNNIIKNTKHLLNEYKYQIIDTKNANL